MRPLTALAGALLLSSAALAAEDADTAPGAMTATIVEGTVTVQPSGGLEQPLAQGASLREGDVVQTGPDSRLEIAIANGSTLRLGPAAKLELRSAPPAGRAFSARLWLGSVWAKVHKLLQDESFHVETDNAVAGVRGTEFLVEAGAQGSEDKVRVYEGAVEVREHGGGWIHRLEPGRELAFRRGIRPQGPRMLDAAADRNHPLMRWVRERPVRLQERRFQPGRREQRQDVPVKKDRRKERRHRLLERYFRR